jgi:pimeloyl-ACP methyl ester carboxylesterase
MKSVNIGDVEIAYEEAGEGTPLIQIHGAGFGHHNFGVVTPYLAPHFRVLNIDQRGFGGSSRPDQEYSFEGWADDVAGFMDALGIERAHVHGTSMGGPVAVNVAARHPGLVHGLIVSCSLAKADAYARLSYDLVRSVARSQGVDSRQLAELIALFALSRDYLEGDGKLEESVEGIREILTVNNSPDVFDQAWRLLTEVDLRGLLGSVQAPTLVIAADQDTIITPRAMAGDNGGSDALRDGIPNAEMAVIAGSNHSHLLERPAESATAIVGFLERLA